MATKRMFSNKVLDTDAFLDMPLSAQALYFHLNLRADDDGFISNPKRVQTYVGASEDDLKLLVLKRFLIAFEDGVMVVKHWRMHNTIQKDRYTPTDYQEDLAMLGIKSNKSYTLEAGKMETKCIQNVYTDKGIDKGLDSDEVLDITPKSERIPYQDIVGKYNEICTNLPKVNTISEARKKAIKARFTTYGMDKLIEAFTAAQESKFLTGNNDRGWSADFDWIMKEANIAKVLDGNYTSKGSKPANSKIHNCMERDYDYDSMLKELIGG